MAVIVGGLLLAACSREVPVPADDRPDTLRAWTSRFRPEDETWRMVTLSRSSALFLDRRIGKGSYPLIGYRMKYENFAPAKVDGRPFRSTLVVYEADCSRMLHHIVVVRAYERLGLAGASFPAANPLPDWAEPPIGSDGYRLTALACTLAQPATYDLDDPRLIKFQAPAVSSSQIAAQVWIDRQGLDGPPWTLLDSGAQTAEFIGDREFEFAAYPLVRYDAKTEFFHPVAVAGRIVRSEWRRVEVDCAGQRSRDLSTTYYEGQNLAGAAMVLPQSSPWVQAAEGATMPLSETTACLFAYDLKYERRLDPATAAGLDLF